MSFAKIKFENVNKKYFHQKTKTIKDLSFEISLGDHICIYGENGSGKSTLLKLISGILQPDSGKVFVSDKVTCVMELEGVFHDFLTGKENMKFFSLINKFENKEIKKKLDKIIEFSELKEKVDDLVNTYSSGMISRMAISPSLILINPIIIFDEVMSALDSKFKIKTENEIAKLLRSKKICFLQIIQSKKDIPSSCNIIFELTSNGSLKVVKL